MSKREDLDGINALLLEEKAADDLGEELMDRVRVLGVSDLHFDEVGDHVSVRWRRDGLMEFITSLEGEKGQSLARFFKVAAGLPPVTAEAPGEGYFEIGEENNEHVSVRVSSIRGVSGTKTSLRILDRAGSSVAMKDLGMGAETAQWRRIGPSMEVGWC